MKRLIGWIRDYKTPCRKLARWVVVVLLVAGGAWTAWNWWATASLEDALSELSASGLSTTPDAMARLETRPEPTENAAHIYNAAFALSELIDTEEDFVDWLDRDEGPQQVRTALRQYEEIFELLYRAAELPRCRFALNWHDGLNLLLPHLSSMRKVGLPLAVRAVVRAEDGSVDESLEDLRVFFALCRSFREEPIVISQIVRIALAQRGIKVLTRVLPLCPSPVDALRRVAADDARGAMRLAYEGEIVALVATPIDGMLSTTSKLSEFAKPVGLIAHPYLKSDVAYLIRVLARFIKLTERSYPQALAPVKELGSTALREGGVITQVFCPALHNSLLTEAKQASRVALAAVAARCFQFRREHGKYPASLDDLPGIEHDPWTGKPFLLETQPDGILLRSQGERRSERDAVEWKLEN